MFEATILDHKRTSTCWSVPVSLSVQVIALGLLLLLPLIYGERLPMLQFGKAVVWLPPAAKVSPPPAAARTTLSRPIFHASTLTAPVRIPPHPAMVIDTAPVIPGGELLASGPPGGSAVGLGVADLLPKNPPPPPEPPRPSIVKLPAPSRPVRVSAGVQEAKRIKFVLPLYPSLARSARISGTVQLVGVIATDGTVQSLQVISGHPLLVNAALEAVRQWRYLPTQLSGQPVQVIAPITVTFTLSQ